MQVYPEGQTIATSLSYDSGTAVYTYRDGRIERKFRAADGRMVSIRDLSSPYEIAITYDGTGRPTRVIDGNGAWSWTITNDASGRVASIAVDGEPSLGWTYNYAPDGNLQTVDSSAGRWRTYTYGASGLTEARDGADRLIEGHAYDASGHATTSSSAAHEVTSIAYDQSGRVPGETKTHVVTGSGEATDYYSRFIAGKMRTVEIAGSCNCGTDDTVLVHDSRGHVTREQNARGYIVQRTYGGDLLTAETTAMRPAGCDPATDTARCRLDPDALASVAVVATAASQTRAFSYGDAHWPDRPTVIQTSSVLQAGGTTEQQFVYDTATGIVLSGSTSGWTDQPARQETRTMATTLYNGTEGAAFDPGGAFQSAWATLPQPAAQRKSVDGPRTDVSDVTTFVYYPLDASVPQRLRGRLAAVRNPAGHITRIENYDAFGNPARTVEPNGVATEATYDALGRGLTTIIKAVAGCDQAADPLCASDLTGTRTYAGAGPLTSQMNFGGGVTAFEYDVRGRLTATSRGPALADLRERLESEYDAVTGFRTAQRWLAREGGAWVQKKAESYHHDGVGNLVELIHSNTTSVGYVYGPQRMLVTVRDENHTTPNTTYTYDEAGRLSTVAQTLAAASITTHDAYDSHGNLASVTDPNGNVTTYVYDDFGQLLSQQSPVTGLTRYRYDKAGNLTFTEDANGASTTRTYDVLNRVSQAISARSGLDSETVTWAYDSAIAADFGIGRLASMTDPSGATSYRYTRRGMLRSEERTIDSWSSSTAYAYDADGNRTMLGKLAYTYDFAGRPLSVAWHDCPACTAVPIVTSASYLPFGPERTTTFGNGTTQSRLYDARYRITENKLTGPGAITLANFTYATDAAGNITAISDVLDSSFNRVFGYDDLNRLTSASTGASLWGAAAYAYDALGNLLSENIGGWTAAFTYSGTTPRISTSTEQEQTFAVEYDAVGNEVSTSHALRAGPGELEMPPAERIDVWRQYSPRNLVASVGTSYFPFISTASQYDYRYDGRGVRVHLSGTRGILPVGSSFSLDYVYTPELNLSVIRDPLGETTELVWFNGHPVAQITPSGPWVAYTFTDHLGTPIVQTDSGGNVTWFGDYEPYGRLYSLRAGNPATQPLRLPGQDEAAHSLPGAEESHNIFRWYRAGWGRYTSADPVFTAGRSEYSYALDNPLIFVDRDGREPAFGNNEQTKCLLCTVYAESRGQSTACQWAVASVIINRVRKAQEKGKPASVCSIVSASGQFDGYNNKNYQQCAKGCLPAWPSELQDVFNNFQNGFSVNPDDATFFGNNTPAMSTYFGTKLGLTKVPFPSCPAFQFYKE